MIELKYDGKGPLRLDRFIMRQCPQLPFGLLQRYLRENKIKLNGKKQPLATALQNGDVVRLYLPKAQAENRAPVVLYEDAQLLALDKPAGQRCQNEDTAEQSGTLLGDARAYTGLDALALCHRLDTGTSGVILLAKTEAMLDFVAGLLKERALEKSYVGLVLGRPAPPAGTLKHWLAKDAGQGLVRAYARPAKGALPAQTAYETLQHSDKLSLLRLHPRTGRTHQLRAQLAAAGTPLLGDSKYGVQAENRAHKCRYQCLCAVEVRFPAIAGGPFAAYSGLRIACQMPWFYANFK